MRTWRIQNYFTFKALFYEEGKSRMGDMEMIFWDKDLIQGAAFIYEHDKELMAMFPWLNHKRLAL